MGRWSDLAAVAVVGSRAPTDYGRRTARRLAAELVERGIAVVSGLARGVDAEAHEAALNAGGKTWAVLGSGFAGVYPPDNRDLFRRIAGEGGLALSEYSFDAAPAREMFPRRNRIVAGLAEATVVVEGRYKSGALITARFAAEYGRDVFAVPGPADSPLSEAPHKLLRDGARFAANGADIATVFGPGRSCEPRRKKRRPPPPDLDRDAARILQILGGDSLSLEELCRAAGLDMPRLSLIMFDLEIKDLVSPVPGQRYAKKSH